MEVTLERVQFKFATIIGELCSAPTVLSQFAVWLDLRLAEYKSKGSISLDCSGAPPEPDWIKGLPQVTSNKTADKPDSSNGEVGDMGESFFSLSQDTGQTSNNDLDFSSRSSNSSGLPKGYNDRQREPEPEIVVLEDEEDVSNDQRFTQTEPFEIQYRQQYSNSTADPAAVTTNQSSHYRSSVNYERFNPYRSHYGGNSSSHQGKRNSTARNIAAVLSHLRKWLFQDPRNETRDILQIPFAELDAYLAEFFRTIKKSSGQDYTKRSFEVCRYSLERYLKQQKYPYSIGKSAEFSLSQQAFQKRKLLLRETADPFYFTPSSATSVSTPAAENLQTSSNPVEERQISCNESQFQQQSISSISEDCTSNNKPSTSSNAQVLPETNSRGPSLYLNKHNEYHCIPQTEISNAQHSNRPSQDSGAFEQEQS